MSKNEFIKRVNKQLWFLNAKEKMRLTNILTQLIGIKVLTQISQ